MLVGTLLHELLTISKTLIPRQVFDKILSLIQNFHSQTTLIIDENLLPPKNQPFG
ncbi:hypothetical protein CsSME_00021647 [Camellia sinensis var. sinensis]